jgi:hypothetical protein
MDGFCIYGRFDANNYLTSQQISIFPLKSSTRILHLLLKSVDVGLSAIVAPPGCPHRLTT